LLLSTYTMTYLLSIASAFWDFFLRM
jgi:hypothetical protein